MKAVAAGVAVAVAVSASVQGMEFNSFAHPAKEHHPETWFHIIGGNASKEGLTEDIDAIAQAGLSVFKRASGSIFTLLYIWRK